MKTIEERAKEYSDRHKSIENSYFRGYNYNYNVVEEYDAEKFAYEAGAYDQKTIDDERIAELEKEKASLILEINKKNKRIAELKAMEK